MFVLCSVPPLDLTQFNLPDKLMDPIQLRVTTTAHTKSRLVAIGYCVCDRLLGGRARSPLIGSGMQLLAPVALTVSNQLHSQKVRAQVLLTKRSRDCPRNRTSSVGLGHSGFGLPTFDQATPMHHSYWTMYETMKQIR